METELKVLLNTVIYAKEDNTLGSLPIGLEGRISKKEAEQYFEENSIPFKEVFKVEKKYYSVSVDISQMKEIQ